MVVVGLVEEVLGLLNGLLGHFVSTPTLSLAMNGDGEWSVVGTNVSALTNKGNYLIGAVADIAVYGAILVDWVIQALLGSSQITNTVMGA
jgi:hypothetical protein